MVCRSCHKEIPDNSKYCMLCGKKMITEMRRTKKRANGMGTVYRMKGRSNKPWRAVASDRRTIGYFATRKDAEHELVLYTVNPPPENFDATFEEIYQIWSDDNPELSKRYRGSWKYLKRFASVKMRDIKAQHFNQCIESSVADGQRRSTCEKIRTLASHICKKGMELDLINKNYAQFMKLPPRDAQERDIFTPKEIALIEAHSAERTAQIILTMLYAGLRIDELFGILRCNVYLDKHYMVGGEKTKAGINRIIPISDKIYPFIERWYQEGNQYLVANRNGGRMNKDNYRKREFYPFLESLGILQPIKKGISPRLTPHCCRHTFISMMVSKQVQPELLKEIVGHESYETTIRFYNHVTDEDVCNMVQAVNSI